jgi:hypothetical protein
METVLVLTLNLRCNMPTYILVIWTIVSGAYPSGYARDWRPVGEFTSLARCQAAAVQLVTTNYRCLAK